MLVHSVIIGIILYAVMIFALGQDHAVAENRSILIASVVLIYRQMPKLRTLVLNFGIFGISAAKQPICLANGLCPLARE